MGSVEPHRHFPPIFSWLSPPRSQRNSCHTRSHQDQHVWPAVQCHRNLKLLLFCLNIKHERFGLSVNYRLIVSSCLLFTSFWLFDQYEFIWKKHIIIRALIHLKVNSPETGPAEEHLWMSRRKKQFSRMMEGAPQIGSHRQESWWIWDKNCWKDTFLKSKKRKRNIPKSDKFVYWFVIRILFGKKG